LGAAARSDRRRGAMHDLPAVNDDPRVLDACVVRQVRRVRTGKEDQIGAQAGAQTPRSPRRSALAAPAVHDQSACAGVSPAMRHPAASSIDTLSMRWVPGLMLLPSATVMPASRNGWA